MQDPNFVSSCLSILRYKLRQVRLYLRLFPWGSADGAVALAGLVAAPLAVFWGPINRLINDHILIATVSYLVVVGVILFKFSSLERIMDLSAIDKQQAEKTLQLIHSGLRNKEMYRTLRVIYEPFAIATNQALGLSGNAGFRLADDHAAVFCEFSDAQTLADICGNDGTTSVDATKFAIDAGARQDLISKVRSVDGTPNQDIESGNNYCLQSVNVDRGRLSISIQRATYGQILRTSDCLIEEIGLFYGLAEGLKFKSEHVLWLLPWRRRVMAVDEKWRLFAQPRSRAAGLGMAALTAYQSQNRKFEALLGFRSNAVATYTNKWHVVPGWCPAFS